MPNSHFFKILSASAVFFSFTSFAQAEIDAKKVMDLVAKRFAEQGSELVVESSTLSGSTITAKNVSFKIPNSGAYKFGDLILENVTEDGTGYKVEKISTPAFKNDVLDFAGGSMSKISIAGLDETDLIKKNIRYETVDIGTLKYFYNGAEVFRIDNAKALMSPYTPGSPLDFDVSISGIYGDLTKIPDPKTQEMLKTLGYSQINSTITAKGSWNPLDGRVTYNLDFMTKDVGTFNNKVDISGYTPQLAAEMQSIRKIKDPKEQTTQLTKLTQNLTINSFSMKFEDGSITGRLLDFFAKQSGRERSAVVAQTKGIVQFGTSMLQNQEFAKTVVDSVGSYLDAPKSFEIKASPATPVAISTLTALKDPQELIKLLNFTTSANQ
jgi:hypothetical protein